MGLFKVLADSGPQFGKAHCDEEEVLLHGGENDEKTRRPFVPTRNEVSKQARRIRGRLGFDCQQNPAYKRGAHSSFQVSRSFLSKVLEYFLPKTLLFSENWTKRR